MNHFLPVLAGRGQEISIEIVITSTRAASTESKIVPVHKERGISIYWFQLMFACVRTHVYVSSVKKNRINVSNTVVLLNGYSTNTTFTILYFFHIK